MVTPNEKYAELGKVLGAPNLYFKREDLHPLGSHKGRSIPHMIDVYVKLHARRFAISSSGNAALAAGLYVKELNEKTDAAEPITLEILVGKNIAPKKLAKLETLKDENIHVSIHDRPKQALLVKTKSSGEDGAGTIVSLRQSDDDSALVGYESLAKELAEIPDLQAIFIGTSSGTTAQALANYFSKQKRDARGEGVQIHIVQTPTCHPIVDAISGILDSDQGNQSSEKSIADAIVDRTALRKEAVAELIGKTGGEAWIANNESLTSAIDITKQHTGVFISPNSALSVAGLMQAIYTGHSWNGAVACVICGD
jgi:threonine dehydratase